jgi:hypothetical protein
MRYSPGDRKSEFFTSRFQFTWKNGEAVPSPPSDSGLAMKSMFKSEIDPQAL